MKIEDLHIGQQVRFVGNSTIGECFGVVLKLYPPDEFDDEDYPGAVLVKPDELPEKWPYRVTRFAPWVHELEPAPSEV